MAAPDTFDSIDELLAALRAPMPRYPAAAVAEAVERLDELEPRLLKVLEDAAASAPLAEEGERDFLAAIFAAHLLAEGRRTSVHPVLLRILSLPGEGAYDVLGDMVTEDMPPMLWRTSGGDLSGVLELANDRAADCYCRVACLQVLPFAWAEGALSREAAVSALEELLTEAKREPDDETVVAEAVRALCDFGGDDSLEQIREVYELDLVDPSWMDWDDVERHLGLDREAEMETLKRNHLDLLSRELDESLELWVSLLGE